MHSACVTTLSCVGTLQIRNVPDDVRSALKARAAAAGQSLSEYLLAEVTRISRRPTLEEMKARIPQRDPVGELPPAAEVLADARRNG